VNYLTLRDQFLNDAAEAGRWAVRQLNDIAQRKLGVSHEKYLVTATPADTTANAVLKFAFENSTSGTNQTLDLDTSWH